jgi:hypothetical protein
MHKYTVKIPFLPMDKLLNMPSNDFLVLIKKFNDSLAMQLFEQGFENQFKESVSVVMEYNFPFAPEHPFYQYVGTGTLILKHLFPGRVKDVYALNGYKESDVTTGIMPEVGVFSQRIGSRQVEEEEIDIFIHELRGGPPWTQMYGIEMMKNKRPFLPNSAV